MHWSCLHSSKCKLMIPLIFISDSTPPKALIPLFAVVLIMLRSLIMFICIRASTSLLILSMALSMRNSIRCFLRYMTMLIISGTPSRIMMTWPLTVIILVSRQLMAIQV